ncbi:hypothetical protein AKJ50_00565 [candidate division MSBL1 archaeon SCGC-AAA382A13]|uniref:ATP-dependent DNA ligase family profile domain-containing protein n=1 Tax=candidate division MSBL1 archaeon SCGC-AAA382A13 TaxID=1698279 RepID=A0A133VGJ8_9EURY|nr:hypothetical protein AKJ50_00565 [candidate division MSBL1 archaeon SCGC-AAA382A13]
MAEAKQIQGPDREESTSQSSKTEKVLEILSEEGPLTTRMLKEKTGMSNLDSLMSNLWEKGYVLASPSVRTLELFEKNGKYTYKNRNERFYIKKKEEDRVTRRIKYETYNKRTDTKDTVTKKLEFTTRELAERQEYSNTSQQIIEALTDSEIALFSSEIAEKIDLSKNQVRTGLSTLKKKRKVKQRGKFDPTKQKETWFENGYLYYLNRKQYKARLQERDVLSDYKQRLYDKVKENCELDNRMTPSYQLFGKNQKNHDRKSMKQIKAVYKDLEWAEVSSMTLYYIEDELTDEEIKEQKEYWKKQFEKKSKEKVNIGYKHEDFFQLAVAKMEQESDLYVNSRFDFRVARNGKLKHNMRVKRRSNPKRLYEFDRVLILELEPFYIESPESREIKLVFEAKYKKRISKRDIDNFLDKLADTYKFGSKRRVKLSEGYGYVEAYVPKLDVVPVFIMPSRGREFKHNGERINTAQYAVKQGVKVLFTQEFERYLQKKSEDGERRRFPKLFNEWYKDPENDQEFRDFVLDKLGIELEKSRPNKREREIEEKSGRKDLKLNRHFKPMNPSEHDDEPIDYEVAVEPKYDGIRSSLHLDKEDETVRGYTRAGEKIELSRKVKDRILESLQNCNNAILDSEYLRDKNEFRVFDNLLVDGVPQIDKQLRLRRKTLEQIVEGNETVKLVEQETTNRTEEVENIYKKRIKEGYEGIVIKDISSLYSLNSRSSDWLKWKHMATVDLKVVDVEKKESNKSKPWVHKLACERDGDMHIMFNYANEERHKLGSVLEGTFLELTGNEKLRYPKNIRVREDKEEPNSLEEIEKAFSREKGYES